MGVPKEILENILLSGEETLPDVFPVLKADFDVNLMRGLIMRMKE